MERFNKLLKERKKMRGCILIILILILAPIVYGEEKYSYEKAEELTPLIDWRSYGTESFNEAVNENKPIFLLLTAPSWCYWCQVYESEDYLFNSKVVEVLNRDFIPVYVDADKRQDLTRQYLEGGWPSTTIMTPSRERIHGYSGPRPVINMLENFQKAIDYVKTHNFYDSLSYDYEETTPKQFTINDLNGLINGYASYTMRIYDKEYGGFGGGQKFPQGRTLDFALDLYELSNDQQWLDLVKNTLNNQYTSIDELKTNYNLFDPVEGGFHRYGTQKDWTPPHYEKMLYDNARLLKAYYHLIKIENDELTQEVVDKTLMFIEQNWYDPEGGFYGNSDVHGEDAYYGEFPRPINKPRVKETKYTDWNSEAILTYLYLFQMSNDIKYMDMAEKSLDFFMGMIGTNGAYHYYRDGEMGVTGSLLDNSYLLLAFVDGYNVLGNNEYLEIAKNLADYSIENLYDWNSGGFFERNSKDKNIYAPGDNVRLSKPGQENGIISYALLKLYKITNNDLYLNAAIKTIGNNFDLIGGLDRGYYYVKSAQFILQNNLLVEFNALNFEIIEKEKQDNFWLNDILNTDATEFVASQKGIDTLEGSFILLLIIALLAGFVSFASPCSLPILPAYIAYSFKSSKQNIKGMTIAFFLGLSLIFTVIGMSTTAIGLLLRQNLMLFSQIAGIAIISFGIYMLLGGGFSGFKIKQKKPTSYLGSFLFGSALGISWTPCVGPILVALLLVASTVGSVAKGGILLFVYSIGLALPLILISMYIEKLNKKSKLWEIIQGKEIKIFGKRIHSTTLVSGLLFIILGYLIFSGLLYSFNQYVTTSGFQKVMFNIEELLLGLVG